MSQIVTEYMYVPGPLEGHDWVAIFDGDEEQGLRGYGATEEAAKADLVEQWEDEQEPDCPTCNDQGVVMVRPAGHEHSDDLAEYEPCPARCQGGKK